MTPRLPRTDNLLRQDWWVSGLSLGERAVTAASITDTDTGPVDERARRWLTQWHGAYLQNRTGTSDHELDEETLLRLLAESPQSLAGRVTRPAWVDTVEQAVHAATSPPADVPLPADWRDAFAVPLRPFVTNASAHVSEQAGRLLHVQHADRTALVDGFAAKLSRQLVRIAARTVVCELNARRPASRTDAIRGLAEPAGLARLVNEYPVLARLLGQASMFATEAYLELLARFAADRTVLIDTLLDGVDPGPIVAIETGRGDTHLRGRSVATLSFADGRRVVYKPRDLVSHMRFTAIVNWLNHKVPGLGVRTAAAMARPGYGWMEFIDHRPLTNLAQADLFYRRQGALLALLYAVHASDFHYQNLLACGDQPVLVDVETLFHPPPFTPGGAADPATRMLRSSVLKTGLLPTVAMGGHGAADMSGLGGDRGEVSPSNALQWKLHDAGEVRLVPRTVRVGGEFNRPRLEGHEIDVADHERALLDGFRRAYDAIIRHRGEFTDLVDTCADIETRVVIRNTRGYLTLLDESTRPDLLRDALHRDQMLYLLWEESAHRPVRSAITEHELADLWAGDVPMFSARPASTDLWTSGGQRLPDMLDRSGLATARDKIAAMSELDRRDQEWIITAALATRTTAGVHDGADPVPGPLVGTVTSPERLLAAACAVGDQIVARSIGARDRVNWLGLELVDDRHWMVLPMGAGLANGYLGVALFLAQLSELSGIARYGEVARGALTAVPTLFATLAAQPHLVVAVGPGGLHGFGGIAYALARLATLLADDELRSWAQTATGFAATAVGEPGAPNWATGSAGCLAAMTAVHTELGLSDAARLARGCADQLAAYVRHTATDGRPADASPDAGKEPELASGFADGASGIAYSLARFAAAGGDRGHARMARLAMSAARSTPGPGESPHGWCQGTAGLMLARAALADGRTEQGWAARLLTDRPVLRDLSLCHGELGIAETLTVLAATGRDSSAAGARRQHAGQILDALNQYGPACGVPGGVPTPGLLSGLAGIGYGLLRLGFAEQVPSVLLLEATPTTSYTPMITETHKERAV